MKIIFRLIVFVLSLNVLNILNAQQPGFLGTQLVNGTYNTHNLTDYGKFRQVRLNATSAGAAFTRNFEFGEIVSGSNSYVNNWRPYGGGGSNTNLPGYNQIILPNTSFPSTSGSATYNNASQGIGALLPAVVSGNYYTVNVTEYTPNSNQNLAVLETSYNPVTISSVVGVPIPSSIVAYRSSHKVTITTSAAPSSGEYVYIRFSTSSTFATSSIIAVSMVGNTGIAWIPACTANSTVYFYAYTSNKTLTEINTAVTACCQDVHDLFTLNFLNNGGANYSFVVNPSLFNMYGNFYVPSDCFPTLNAFVTTLNSSTTVYSNKITCFIKDGYTETVPAGGIVIEAEVPFFKPITIKRDSSSSVLPTFTASSVNSSGSILDAVIKINGADWIIIDGIKVQENASNSATPTIATNTNAEFGFSLLRKTTTNGSNFITIKNCEISLYNTYLNTFGIYNSVRHSSTAALSASNPIDSFGISNHFTCLNNKITNCNIGVAVVGSSTNAFVNSYLNIANNTISNFGKGSKASSYISVFNGIHGILIANTQGYTIQNNTLSSVLDGSSADAFGIQTYTSSSPAPTTLRKSKIMANKIALKNNANTVDLTAIKIGTTFSNENIEISSNVINGLGYSSLGNGKLTGIEVDATSSPSITIINNVLDTFLKPTSSSSAVYGIRSNAGYNKQIINNNAIKNFSINSTNSASSAVYVETSNLGNLDSLLIQSNTIANLTNLNTNIAGIYLTSTATVGSVIQIQNNTISNIKNNTLGGSVFGIYDNSGNASVSNRPIKIISNNTIANLIGLPSATGIYVTLANVLTVNNNSIKSILSNTNSTGFHTTNNNKSFLTINSVDSVYCNQSSGNAVGIESVSEDTSSILNNKVSFVQALNGIAKGIKASNGDSTKINNNKVYYVNSGIATNLPSAFGIDVGDANNSSVNYNTVIISGNPLYSTAVYTTIKACKLNNNLLANLSTATGGITAAHWRSSNVTTLLQANNNAYYAGTPGPSNLIFKGGSTNNQTLQAYKANVNPKENKAVTGSPIFISTSINNTSFLLPDSANNANCFINGKAKFITNIPTDFNNNLRSLTKPDIGAHEFGLLNAFTIDSIMADTTICNGTNLVLKAFVTSLFPPTYNWMLNGSAIANGAKYSGVNTTQLTINNVNIADTGKYRLQCIVCPLTDTFLTSTIKVDLKLQSIIPIALTLSKDTVCAGTMVTINQSGGTLGTGANWQLMQNSCTNLPIATTLPTNVNISATTTFYLKAAGSCNTTACVSATLAILPNTPGNWSGLVNTNWNNAANWCGGIPTTTTNVFIDKNRPNQPAISSAANALTINVDTGALLTIASGAILNIYKDLINAGNTLTTGGTVQIVGTSLQTIDSLNTTNLVINNTIGGVQLNGNINVSNNLTLTNGIVTTGIYKICLNNNSSSALIAGSGNTNFMQSWVNGVICRQITTNTNTYNFPVGNASQSHLLQFINNNLVGPTQLVASFIPKPGTDIGLVALENTATYSAVASSNVWLLTPNTIATSGLYNLKLFYNTYTNFTSSLVDFNHGILRRANASSNAADWQVPGGSKWKPGFVLNGYAQRDSISSFSQFAIATAATPLVNNIIKLNGQQIQNTHKLSWDFSGNLNNTTYKIYNITTAQFVNTPIIKINETQFYAQFLANNAAFYKIIAQLPNGQITQSAPVLINGIINNNWEVYPIPASQKIYITNANYVNTEVQIQLYNLQGQNIYKSNTSLTKATPVNIEKYPKGVYILRIIDKQGTPLLNTNIQIND